MKKFFFSMVALMVVAVSFAQNTLVATLSHGDAVKMFFGPSALINANDEAENGDVITLSGGTFACPYFTKGITIRGTGINAENPTTIGYVERVDKHYTINIPQSGNYRFSLEGCIVDLYLINSGNNLSVLGESSNIYFLKCKFKQAITYTSSGSANFVNCDIQGIELSGSGNVKLTNCYLLNFTNDINATSKAEFFNCLLRARNIDYNRSTLVNCVLFQGYNISFLPAEAMAMNCIAVTTASAELFKIFPETSIDCHNATVPQIFKTYKEVIYDSRYNLRYDVPTEPYELTDEAKTKYLGTDGKEIGLYGGQYPFNLTPNYPRITKLNVAKQTTADNKLSVDIEVSATE